MGISLVGKVPAILPSLSLPLPEGIDFGDLVQDALGIFIVSFGSGIVTARSFGSKNHYRVDSNRELFGFGAANIASGLFGGFPVAGAVPAPQSMTLSVAVPRWRVSSRRRL